MPKPSDVHDDNHRPIPPDYCQFVQTGISRAILDAILCIAHELARINRTLKKLPCGGDTGRRAAGFGFSIGLPHKKKKAQNMSLEIKITNEQQIKVTLTPKTDTGKPAKLDGKPTWETISGNSAVNVSDDGLSATLVSSDDPGDTEILVKADADLGEGVEEISDTIKLSVVGATAKNLGLSAGTPEAKPGV